MGHATEGAVTLLEGRPPRVRRVLRGFGEPRYAAIAPDGRYAFVTDSGHGELAVIDLERGAVDVAPVAHDACVYSRGAEGDPTTGRPRRP